MVVRKTSFDWEFCSNNDDGSSLTEMFRMTFLGTTLIYGPDMFCMLQTALLLRITWHWHTAINKPNRQHSHLTSCHDDDELQMTGKCKAVPSYTRSPQAAWPSWQPGTMTSVPAPRLDTCLAAPGTRPWVVCDVLPPHFMEIRKSIISMVASRDLKSRVHVNSELK